MTAPPVLTCPLCGKHDVVPVAKEPDPTDPLLWLLCQDCLHRWRIRRF